MLGLERDSVDCLEDTETEAEADASFAAASKAPAS